MVSGFTGRSRGKPGPSTLLDLGGSRGLVLFALIVLPILSAPSIRAADTLRIANDQLSLGFDKQDGRMVEFASVEMGKDFVGSPGSKVWRLELLPYSEERFLGADDADSFRWERSRNGQELQLRWGGFDLDQAKGLTVMVTVRLPSDVSVSKWSLVLEGIDALGIEKIHFARIAPIRRLGDKERVAVPSWMGLLAQQPRDLLAGKGGKGRRLDWYYPGQLSLQTVAFYQPEGPGLYLAADDTLAYRKNFAFWGNGRGGVGSEIVHVVGDPGKSRDRYAVPYRALIGTIEGDWITVAKRYRRWAAQQAWARQSRLQDRQVPDWLLETGIWVWNRGRSGEVLTPAVSLQREAGLPVSVLWHWWHQGPYDKSFPEYLPPREGSRSFRQALRSAEKRGVHAITYMNQRLWCTATESWSARNASRWAVKEPDGSVWTHTYNIFDPTPCAAMDVTTPFWRNTYAGMAKELLHNYGVDGIYMDQAVSSLVCYDPEHEHSVGGGNYWVPGFRTLSSEIRSRSPGDTPVLLSGEGGGEAWLPVLDNFLTLQVSRERYARQGAWTVIPFFQAVYHSYAITYGSYSSLTIPPYDELWPAEYAPEEPPALLPRKYRQQFYLEQARAFVWGMQPTIANFRASQLTTRPEEMAYLMRLAKVRNRALDYLLHGTFLRPPDIEVPEVEVEFLRLSIYAGRTGAAREDKPESWREEVPGALVGAWRAPDGDVAIALASISEDSVTVALELNPYAYGLEGPGMLRRIRATGHEQVGEYGPGPNVVQVTLPPLGVSVLELVSAESGG